MSDVTQRPEVAPVRPGEELGWTSLEVYLRAHLPGMQGELSVLRRPLAADLCALGVSGDVMLSRYYREVRPFRIYDGSCETHRWAIAKRRLRQDVAPAVAQEKRTVHA